MKKSLFKWGLRLFLLAVVLVVVFFLSLDFILKLLIERNIHAQTGMKAEIGRFHLGIFEPVVEIKDLQLYNTTEFGGAPFLSIPEIHVEYDRAALHRQQIHITLLRFNLGELDVVKGQDGQTNILSLGVEVPQNPMALDTNRDNTGLAELQKRTGMKFEGIDTLNVSVGQFKYLDQQNQSNNLEQKIGLDNCVITNVTSAADLGGLALVVGLRSGDFFKQLVAPDNSGAGSSPQDLLKMLGH